MEPLSFTTLLAKLHGLCIHATGAITVWPPTALVLTVICKKLKAMIPNFKKIHICAKNWVNTPCVLSV